MLLLLLMTFIDANELLAIVAFLSSLTMKSFYDRINMVDCLEQFGGYCSMDIIFRIFYAGVR